MDKFLVSMTKGVFVRRHQSHKMAETVKIFSTTGCRLICWEKPKNINSSGDSVGRNISDRGWAEYLAACKLNQILISSINSLNSI